MIVTKNIEDFEVSEICDHILHDGDIILEEILYLIIHTHGHLDWEEQMLSFQFASGKHTYRYHYVYHKDHLDIIVKKYFLSKEFYDFFSLKLLFEEGDDIGRIRGDGFLAVNLKMIYNFTDEIKFVNSRHIDISTDEVSALEKILKENGRYDILI